MRGPITLLTDFGTADGYAGAVRGVITDISPGVRIDDISHDIAAGDIAGAAIALRRYWREYPENSIHLVVVDPGVGSSRRALVGRVDGRWFVAPDNGVLTYVLQEGEQVEVVAVVHPRSLPRTPAPTFHGRDVFGPVAADLSLGAVLREFGPPIDDAVMLDIATASLDEGTGQGVIVHVDRFGNLATNIPGEWLADGARVEVGSRTIQGVHRTYSEVEPGELLALTGSDGWLEIAVREGSAATTLDAGRGMPVRVHVSSPATPGPPSTAADASA
jgi:S-adenosyl-L-methionine hydrolase (adenosine-forming)